MGGAAFPHRGWSVVDHITLWFGDLTQQGETELVGLAAGAGPGC